jgi:dethiobiotin synthetase
MNELRGLFVVGTDTGVGKTRVAAAIARSAFVAGRKVGVLKPLATGCVRRGESWQCEDADLLIEAIGGGVSAERVTPLAFSEPLAPSVAARRAGAPLQHSQVEHVVREALAWWAASAEIMVVEGVGGLLCPLAEGTTVAELAVMLDYPLVIVARRGLGTLNHTLMTVEAASWRGLRVAGIVLNSALPESDPLATSTNAEELARRLPGVAILAEVEYQADPASICSQPASIDWCKLAKAPRRVDGKIS